MSVRCTAKSDLELAQEKIRELKREIRELKDNSSILQENYILLLRDLGEYQVENAALKQKDLDEYAIIKRLPRDNAALRKMIKELTDCYFLHRNEGLMELMMKADRMLENDVK